MAHLVQKKVFITRVWLHLCVSIVEVIIIWGICWRWCSWHRCKGLRCYLLKMLVQRGLYLKFIPQRSTNLDDRINSSYFYPEKFYAIYVFD